MSHEKEEVWEIIPNYSAEKNRCEFLKHTISKELLWTLCSVHQYLRKKTYFMIEVAIYLEIYIELLKLVDFQEHNNI